MKRYGSIVLPPKWFSQKKLKVHSKDGKKIQKKIIENESKYFIA